MLDEPPDPNANSVGLVDRSHLWGIRTTGCMRDCQEMGSTIGDDGSCHQPDNMMLITFQESCRSSCSNRGDWN